MDRMLLDTLTPQTNDQARLILIIIIAVIALVLIIVFSIRRKRPEIPDEEISPLDGEREEPAAETAGESRHEKDLNLETTDKENPKDE